MKKLRKILRYLVYIIIALGIALALIPFVFKDKIIEGVREAANENIAAKIEFSDIEISLFQSFPDVSVRLMDLDIMGIDTFSGTNLLESEYLNLDLNLPSLWSEDNAYQVNSIELRKPTFKIKVLKNGLANYDIFPESEASESSGNFVLNLDQYAINEAQISLLDLSTDLELSLENFNHVGSGNMTADIYDLNTKSSVEEVTVKSGGVSYLRKANMILDAIINIDLPSNTYTLSDNSLQINNFSMFGEGTVQVLENNDLKIEGNLSTPTKDLKSFLSLIPYAYTKNFSQVKAKGNGGFSASVNGIYNSDTESYPDFNLILNLENGEVQYPDLPSAIKDINVKTQISNTSKDLSNMTIHVEKFAFNLDDQNVTGNVLLSDLQGNSKIKGKAKGNLDLSQLKKAIPLDQNIKLSGLIDLDLSADVSKDQVNSSTWTGKGLEGSAFGKDISYSSIGFDDVKIKTIQVTAKNDGAKFDLKEASMGQSKLDANATFTNLNSFLVSEGKLQGDIRVDGNTIDVNPLLVEAPDTTIASSQDLSVYDLEVEVNADRFLYDAYVFENANLKGHLKNDAFEVKSLETRIGSSQMMIKGDLNNLSQYINNEGELKGDLRASSPSFLLDDLIVESDTDIQEEGIVPIPPNIDINLDFITTKFDYDGIKLDNLNGNLQIKDQVAEIHDAVADGLGGKMAFSGSYATPPNEDPSFVFKYDLNQLKFSETFNQLPSVQAFTPILKYMDGFFNSTLIMNGDLGPDLLPKLSSLNASGYIETLNSSLKNFEVVEKLGKKLSLDKLKNIALDNTKNWIEIIDGKLEIKPQKYKWQDIEVMVSGSHGLDIAMDYNLIFKIPREKLKGSAIGTVANSGLAMLESEAQKLGVDLSVGENIDLLVNIGGSMTQPTYNIKPLGSSEGGTFEENIKDAVKDKVNTEVDKAKDSVKTVINNAKVTFKDTVEKTVTKVIDSTKTVINEKINQAKKEAEEKAKKEAKRVLDSLAKKVVSDSLNKAIENKVIDIIGGKSDEEVDKIKDKITDFNPFKKKKKKKED